MSIKVRLTLLSVASLISLMVIALLGYVGLERTSKNMVDIEDMSQMRVLSNIDGLLLRNHNQYLLTLQHDPAHPEIVKLHDHPTEMHLNNLKQFHVQLQKRVDEFNSMPATQPFRLAAKAYQDSVKQYIEATQKGMVMYEAGEFHRANIHLLEVLNPLLNKTLKDTREFRTALVNNAQQSTDESIGFAARMSQMIWAIAILAFAFMVGLSIAIITSVRKGIQQTVQQVEKVANSMDFNTHFPERKDELNAVSLSLNQMLKNLKLAINETNQVVGAIAQGDYHQRISIDLNGDLDRLKVGVNASADNVQFMMAELDKVMQALHNGQFDIKMDERVPKSFSEKIESALTTINQVIVEINRVMSKMNEGKFRHRVTTQAHGQLAEMKDNINGAMDSLERAMQDITRVIVAQSQGDITQTISAAYHGELRVMTEAVNLTAEKLIDVVSFAVETADAVNHAALEVAQGSLDLSDRVQQQAAAIEQSSATMEEFSAAVQNNAQNALEATNVEKQIEIKSKQASDVMGQTIEVMTLIQQSSHKIAAIVSLIDGIAFQTNLLALNAAVEAARAGEHGRGFAVVAGEVRALAQRSADAAREISGLINESVSRIDQGTRLASASGVVIDEIGVDIVRAAKMSAEIAQASSEQADGISQLQNAISQIDQGTQQNAALVEQTSAAAESMREQSQMLSQRLNFFKLDATKGISIPRAIESKGLKPKEHSKEHAKPKPAKLDKNSQNTATDWAEF